MKTIKKAFLMLLPLLLAGCFQVDQVVTVGPDGSGTVVETFLISRRIAESMASLTAGLGGQEEAGGAQAAGEKKQEPAAPPSFFQEEDIRKRAGKMGPGVSFVGMKRISDKDFEGYRAEYAFSDINQIRLDQEGGPPRRDASGAEPKQKGTSFSFTPGKNPTLVVKQHRTRAAGESGTMEKKGEEAAPPARQAGPEELAMLRQMFAGLRFSVAVVVKGKIDETNATHRDGSRVTLAEIDFGQLLDKPELLARLAEMPPGDTGAALEMMKKIPGMKVDLNDEVRIMFR